MQRPLIHVALALSFLLVPALASADSAGEPGRESGKPNPLKNVYFGEQHLHTSASPNAFAVRTRVTWDDAYRSAKGEEVTLTPSRQKIKKSTPYDTSE